jgi:hypothetical protein
MDIAKDIKRRLLADAKEVWQRITNRKAEAEAITENQIQVAYELARAADREIRKDLSATDKYTSISIGSSGLGQRARETDAAWGSVEVHLDHKYIRIELRDVPRELAIAIIKLVKEDTETRFSVE